MFGLEVLEIVIGLAFVYLLLSIIVSAINEYIAALTNRRGKELIKGIQRLLDDVHRGDSATSPPTPSDNSVSDRVLKHPLIRSLYPERHFLLRRGPLGRWMGKTRMPSYIPARTFALALLDTLGYEPAPASPPASSSIITPPLSDDMRRVIEVLRREAPEDVTQVMGLVQATLGGAGLSDEAQARVVEAISGARNEMNKLHDSVEVWFNNAMDRVSGAYKRYTQFILLLIGLVLSALINADTFQMWRTLAENDELRTALADRAAASLAEIGRDAGLTTEQEDSTAGTDTTAADGASGDTTGTTTDTTGATTDTTGATGDTTGGAGTPGTTETQVATESGDASTENDTLAAARKKLEDNLALLDSAELKLGWTPEELALIGLTRTVEKDGKAVTAAELRPWFWKWNHLPIWRKLLGILVTALALSLGAPFWFDVLNKVINVRAAGRAPDEKPKSPEGGPKRLQEAAPR